MSNTSLLDNINKEFVGIVISAISSLYNNKIENKAHGLLDNVNLEEFIRLSVILSIKSNNDSYITFWLNVFNPFGKKKLKKADYEEILEKLARGAIASESNLITGGYKTFIKRELEKQGCLTNEEIDTAAFETALRDKLIDIDILNKPLQGEIEELTF